jgi:hypothetical protein
MMRTSIAETSAETKARIAGALWLAVMVTGSFAAFASLTLTARADPATLAANILGSEGRYRLGVTANLLSGVFYIGVTVILYDLLKPVSQTLSRLAAFMGLVGSAAAPAYAVLSLAPVFLLTRAHSLVGFNTDQLQGLAFAAVRLNTQVFTIGMMFFGFQIVTVGYLIIRSTFLPRLLGVMLAIGGSTYVIGSLATLVQPVVGARLGLLVMGTAFVGEGSLAVWLLVKGVDRRNWDEQRSRTLPSAALANA